MGVAGKVIEQVSGIRADLIVRGEESQVRVQARSDRIVVAGGQMTIPADHIALPAKHQRDFGMHLQAQQSIHHVDALALQRSGPFDVALFIETRFQLHQHSYLFPVLHCFE